MKICPNCHTQLDDRATYCTTCGMPFAAPPYVAVNPYDHTAEFDPQDIGENKIFATLPYLLGILGVLVAVLAAKESRFVMFHVRQALKLTILAAVVGLAAALTAWLFITLLAAGICLAILSVLQIIGFVQVCGGKAKEPAIVRSFNFLK